MFLGIDWTQISGGSVYTIGVIVGVGVVAFRVRRDSWKDEAEAQKARAERLIADLAGESEVRHRVEIELAREQAKPDATQLATAVDKMGETFNKHRADLMGVLQDTNKTTIRILSHMEKHQETIASMQQALVVLADRKSISEGRDPPLSD